MAGRPNNSMAWFRQESGVEVRNPSTQRVLRTREKYCCSPAQARRPCLVDATKQTPSILVPVDENMMESLAAQLCSWEGLQGVLEQTPAHATSQRNSQTP